jgi:hypothetical protein
MPNLIERAGKKAAALLLGSLEKWVQGMIVLLLTSLSTAAVLYFKEAWHPRLFYALLGATIAFAVSTALPLTIVIVKMIQERRLGKPNRAMRKQVDRLTIADKNAIKDLVMVCRVRSRTEIEGGDPHIALIFHILNMSLRPVSVEGVEGTIRFTETANYLRERTLLREPITLSDKDNSAKDIPFRETGSFTVYQPLTERNVSSLARESARLWPDLTITIKADGCDPVKIPSGPVYIEKNDDWSSDRVESYFIYRDAVRAEAKLRELEAERDTLKELVEKQPQKALPGESGR